jgi:hypothetical protein
MRRPQSAGTIQAGFDVFIASSSPIFRSVFVGNTYPVPIMFLDGEVWQENKSTGGHRVESPVNDAKRKT